eukprot:1806661-Prymnesium_polylepis.1
MDGGGGGWTAPPSRCPPAREQNRGWPRTLRRVSYLTKKVIARTRNLPYKAHFSGQRVGLVQREFSSVCSATDCDSDGPKIEA